METIIQNLALEYISGSGIFIDGLGKERGGKSFKCKNCLKFVLLVTLIFSPVFKK